MRVPSSHSRPQSLSVKTYMMSRFHGVKLLFWLAGFLSVILLFGFSHIGYAEDIDKYDKCEGDVLPHPFPLPKDKDLKALSINLQSAFMTGDMAVAIFFPESNGAIDSNLFDWSSKEEAALEIIMRDRDFV